VSRWKNIGIVALAIHRFVAYTKSRPRVWFATGSRVARSPTHKPGYVAVLNESTHKVVLLISSIPGYNVNASNLGVVGAFGRVTFEVVHKG
jgi:hypothetical protein